MKNNCQFIYFFISRVPKTSDIYEELNYFIFLIQYTFITSYVVFSVYFIYIVILLVEKTKTIKSANINETVRQ